MACLMLIICFFFKQKTAYEMRISDWSSDVCSSDLLVELSRKGLASVEPRPPARPYVGDPRPSRARGRAPRRPAGARLGTAVRPYSAGHGVRFLNDGDRKSTRLNSSH